jgi:hypothetical protein
MAALLAPLAVNAMNQPAKRTSIQIIASALVHLDVIGRKLEGASLNSEKYGRLGQLRRRYLILRNLPLFEPLGTLDGADTKYVDHGCTM